MPWIGRKITRKKIMKHLLFTITSLFIFHNVIASEQSQPSIITYEDGECEVAGIYSKTIGGKVVARALALA